MVSMHGTSHLQYEILIMPSNILQLASKLLLLVDALEAAGGIDPKMVVYASCDIASQRRLMAACTAAAPPAAPGVVGGGSPLYLTGSREVARAVMELVPACFASTGGPNTMVATRLTPAVADAARGFDAELALSGVRVVAGAEEAKEAS